MIRGRASGPHGQGLSRFSLTTELSGQNANRHFENGFVFARLKNTRQRRRQKPFIAGFLKHYTRHDSVA